jgi:hypothetical protein
MAVRIVDLQAQRDWVRIEFDDAMDGAQEPAFKTLVSRWPCFIKQIGGTEVLHGRQLEGRITTQVLGTWDRREWGDYRSNMRLIVIESNLAPGTIFNILYTNLVRFPHRSHNTEFMCQQVENCR